jgi:hypothetical protein
MTPGSGRACFSIPSIPAFQGREFREVRCKPDHVE